MQVDGSLWDLERPLEKSCKLELLDFDNPEGTSLTFLPSICVILRVNQQERRFSGIRLRTYSERLLSGTMVAICVLVPPQMMDSSTRWALRTGTHCELAS